MELRALLAVERRKELVLHPPGQRTEPAEHPLAVGGEADVVAAPVLRIASPLDQLLLLELVEKADEGAAVVAERVGDLRLRLGRALLEQDENRVVVGAEPGLLVLVERALLGGEPEPLEQEQGGGDELCGESGRRLRCRLQIRSHFLEYGSAFKRSSPV